MRNVKKNADNGRERISARRDLTAGEIQQIIEDCESPDHFIALCNAIADAFYFGFSVGHRQAKDEKK